MKCEIEWCKKERSCFHYCSEHHNVVCMEGNSYIPAIRPTKRVPDRAKSAVKSRHPLPRVNPQGAAGNASRWADCLPRKVIMNAVELEKELWKINDQLMKAGIKPHEYPTMADAVAELRGQLNRYKALFDEVISDRDRLLNEKAAQQNPPADCCPRCDGKGYFWIGNNYTRCLSEYHDTDNIR